MRSSRATISACRPPSSRSSNCIELQQTALQQNITTLRNRVNEIGVAEPVIQQQGADRVVVQLPGVQDTVPKRRRSSAPRPPWSTGPWTRPTTPTPRPRPGVIPPESRLLYRFDQGQPVLLKKRLIVSGDQLIGASSGFDQQTGQPQVSVTLDGVGAKRMLDFTREQRGQPHGGGLHRTETRRPQNRRGDQRRRGPRALWQTLPDHRPGFD